MKSLVARLGRFFRGRKKARFARPPDPRVDQSPWLRELLDELGERYRLGRDTPDGIQVLCRVAREKFKEMRVWVDPSQTLVLGDYDVRIEEGKTADDGRALIDRKVTPRLAELGLTVARENVEEWAGLVLTRRYLGRCPEAKRAAAAVAFMCRGSEQVMNTALE